MEEILAFLERVRGLNGPVSDKYSMVANRWVEEDHAARLSEDTKSIILAERKNQLIKEAADRNEKLSDAAAERLAKSEPAWRALIENTALAKTKANLLKVNMEVLDKREWEHRSIEATRRAEMKLT